MEKVSTSVSTSGWLHNPQELFRITSDLNLKSNSICNIELYPTYFTIPGFIQRINANDITTWYQDKSTKYANINRVHLPFAYDLKDKFWRVFADSKESINQRFYHLADTFLTGYSTNNYAINLATEIAQIQGRNIGLNIHSDVFLSYIKNNKLNDIAKPGINSVLLENELPYHHRYFKTEKFQNIDEIIKTKNRHNLNGIVFALDHFQMQNLDSLPIIQKHQKDIQVIHLATKNHQPINFKSERNQKFLKKIIDSFDHPFEFVLDYSPFAIKSLKSRQKYDLIKDYVDVIHSIQ